MLHKQQDSGSIAKSQSLLTTATAWPLSITSPQVLTQLTVALSWAQDRALVWHLEAGLSACAERPLVHRASPWAQQRREMATLADAFLADLEDLSDASEAEEEPRHEGANEQARPSMCLVEPVLASERLCSSAAERRSLPYKQQLKCMTSTPYCSFTKVVACLVAAPSSQAVRFSQRKWLSSLLAVQMAEDEDGVPSFDNLDAVAHLRQSERYKSVMLVRSCRSRGRAYHTPKFMRPGQPLLGMLKSECLGGCARDRGRPCVFDQTKMLADKAETRVAAMHAEGARIAGGGSAGRWRWRVLGGAERGGPRLPLACGLQPACGGSHCLHLAMLVICCVQHNCHGLDTAWPHDCTA